MASLRKADIALLPLQSGELDECGVCDGLSNSCAISLQLGLAVDASLVHGDGVQVGGVAVGCVHCCVSVGQ